MLRALPELYGGPEVLAEARAVLAGAPAAVGAALDELEAIRALLERRAPELELGFDLAELYGYHYHTGAVFSAYAPDHGRAVARGGRYDDIGGAFGRARPATGFDADLKVLAERTVPQDGARELVTAPDDAELAPDRAAALWEAVAGLRGRGVRVVVGEAPGATLRLEWRDGAWTSVPLVRKRADGES
jgi:ATP phosphoribosyltransferase regulatory subunit